MNSLAALWDTSLLLCCVALVIMLGLMVSRAIGNVRSRRRDAMRREMLSRLLQGSVDPGARTALGSRVAADLVVELADLVRGSERETVLLAAEAAGATKELERRLTSRVPQNRLLAAEALAMFPAYAAHVANAALEDPNPDVRLGAALALAQEDRAPPVATLIRKLGIGSDEKSLLAVSLLRDLVRADPQGVLALVDDPVIPFAAKLSATDALAESGMVEHAPIVARLAVEAQGDVNLQPRIFHALGRIGHPSGFDAIRQGLRSTAWEVRAAAAMAAGQSGLADEVARLAELLGDEQWWVRFRAGEALSRLGRQGRDALHHAAQAGTPQVRTAALALIAEKAAA